MAFKNKQQDVIDIKITQFGKRELSRGRFKPHSYRFFDDDIVYDIARADRSEHQNDTEDGIKQAIRNETLHISTGIEEDFELETRALDDKNIEIYKETKKIQLEQEKESLLRYPLCNYEINSEDSPAINIKLFDSVFGEGVGKSSTQAMLGIDIPKIFLTSSYTLSRDTREQIQIDLENIPEAIRRRMENTEEHLNLIEPTVQYLDGSKISMSSQSAIFEVEEENVYFKKHNFSLEIYEYIEIEDASGTRREVLVLIDDEEELEALFEVEVDNEIIDERLSTSRNKNKNFYMT